MMENMGETGLKIGHYRAVTEFFSDCQRGNFRG
jgi:hypothetical protein